MKSLSKYLSEGVLDADFDIEGAMYEVNIMEWIEQNTNTAKGLSFDTKRTKDGKYIVNASGAISMKSEATSLTNEHFVWGTIKSYFSCAGSQIQSLEGGPSVVRGLYNCSRCQRLTSLKGIATRCSWIDCSNCKNLIELAAPKRCQQFDCTLCTSLPSLIGGPQDCDNFICVQCESLTDLVGAPKKCKVLDCSHCYRLESLEGASPSCEKIITLKCTRLK